MKSFLWFIISLTRIMVIYGFGFFICLIFPLYVASEYFKPILDVSYGNDVVGTGSSNFMVFVLSMVCSYIVTFPAYYLFFKINTNYLQPKYDEIVDKIYKP